MKVFRVVLVSLIFASIAVMGAQSQQTPSRNARSAGNEGFVTLRGNTHPLARPETDQGAASDELEVSRVLLVLKRAPDKAAALSQLLIDLQTSTSTSYHRWLTPGEFGERFGPSKSDVEALKGWLGASGFQVNHVSQGRMAIEFSGTAGMIRQAFHTEIHKFAVNGVERLANASDPQIPNYLVLLCYK
jgi:hypothetical protein